jgi:hypothetical protein
MAQQTRKPFMHAFENDDWIIDDFGMRSKMRTGRFDISAERLHDVQTFTSGKVLFWPTHMANESWVNLDSFVEAKYALLAHQDRYPAAMPALLLEESVNTARRIAARSPLAQHKPVLPTTILH